MLFVLLMLLIDLQFGGFGYGFDTLSIESVSHSSHTTAQPIPSNSRALISDDSISFQIEPSHTIAGELDADEDEISDPNDEFFCKTIDSGKEFPKSTKS